jgi:D-alanine-D-alanine ligase-like ATP-grasp enzyme
VAITKESPGFGRGLSFVYNERMEITAPSKGKRGACLACDDAPVPHLPTFLAQSFEAWLADKRTAPRERWSQKWLRDVRYLADRTFENIPRLMHAIGLLRVSHTPETACSYRSQVVWEEALRRGIPMEQLMLFRFPTELYRAKIDGTHWHFFQSLPIPPRRAHATFAGIDDKTRFKQLLRTHGIPVTTARVAHSLEEARAAFADMQKPIVVKPRIGSRARHTTTNIHALADLEAAYALAHELCAQVLLEEHLEGPVCRATAVDGKLCGFLEMKQARVVGDGIHTIAELLAEKNARRPERVGAIVLEAEHYAFLARSGYTIESVPALDAVVELSRRTGRFEGGETREMPDEIHSKLRVYIERAAEALRAPVVGFDIIIPDATKDPDTQRWGFLEANSLPYIDLHYAPLYGEPSNVAAAVWDLWR